MSKRASRANQITSAHGKNGELLMLRSIQPASSLISRFPSTRYYGSKRKLLPWIFENIKTLEFDSVLDGFGGTASVSLLFKAMNKDVTYADAFEFNRVVARAVLRNEISIPEREFVDFLDSVRAQDGLISREFEGIFYESSENSWLDGFLTQLFSSRQILECSDELFYALFQACLKKRPFNSFHRTKRSGQTLNREIS